MIYEAVHDGIEEVIEASSMAHALELWTRAKRAEWGEDYQEEDEPESIRLLVMKVTISETILDHEFYSTTPDSEE